MTCQNVLLSHSSLRSPTLLPAPPHPSPPPADSSDVAGRTAAKREALWDVGGLCFPGNRGCPAAADGQAEESAAAGAQSQGECFICLYSNEAQSRSVKTMYSCVQNNSSPTSLTRSITVFGRNYISTWQIIY